MLSVLHEIGNGNAQSKQDGCMCLITALRKRCPFPERTCCIGCEYEISTKTTFYMMTHEVKRLNVLYSTEQDPTSKKRVKAIASKVVLPALNEMLHCVRSEYGTEAYNTLLSVLQEEIAS